MAAKFTLRHDSRVQAGVDQDFRWTESTVCRMAQVLRGIPVVDVNFAVPSHSHQTREIKMTLVTTSTRIPLRQLFVIMIAFLLFDARTQGQDTGQDGHIGTYALATVDGRELPATVLHGETSMVVHSGIFRINRDGTCSSKIVLSPYARAAITREVNATYTRDGASLNMQWSGAGKTRGKLDGKNFEMMNEGIVYCYRRQSQEPQSRVGSQPLIPDTAKSWNGHHYLRVDDAATKHVAQRRARSMGGHLARVESAVEQSFIHELIKNGPHGWYAIDGSDEENEGVWIWSNGEPISYLDWDANEPSGTTTHDQFIFQHDLQMNPKNGKMHDGVCGGRNGFIVEWDE